MKDVRYRAAAPEDFTFLATMLGESAVWRPDIFGFVAEDVPELAIAVIASRRHEGIGRGLLIGLIDASVDQGCPALSLSVAEQNPARGLYESVGFVPVRKHGSSWTMVRHSARSS